MSRRALLPRLSVIVAALLPAWMTPLHAQSHHHDHAPTPASEHESAVVRDDEDHSAHSQPSTVDAPREPIPIPTDADRAAAFPAVGAHAMHGDAVLGYLLLDRLEFFDADGHGAAAWEASAWIGNDLDRLWLRSEGERVAGDTEVGDLEVLYGRSIARWWDVVAGLRHDFGEGPTRDFAAFGVIGMTPYKFEVEATAYLGERGQTALRMEAEYDTLLTNRLVLQWQLEAELHGQDDAPLGIGSGLGTVEAGLRLRFEITRRFAPYIGVVRERAFGGTADFRREASEPVDDTRWVAGLRFWF